MGRTRRGGEDRGNGRENRGHGQAQGAARAAPLDLPCHLGHEPVECIRGSEDDVDRLAIEDAVAAAGRVEQRLDVVGEPLHRRELQDPGVALERVEGPKHGGKRVGIAGILLQHEHALLDAAEQILRILAE